jgi:hypothetical protein
MSFSSLASAPPPHALFSFQSALSLLLQHKLTLLICFLESGSFRTSIYMENRLINASLKKSSGHFTASHYPEEITFLY